MPMKTLCVLLLALTLSHAPAQAAVDIDGVDDLFSIAQAVSVFLSASTGTMSAWVVPTTQTTGTTCSNGVSGILMNDTGGWLSLLRDSDENYCAFSETAGSVQTRVEPAATLTVGALTLVTWRHSGGNLVLLINGVVSGTAAAGDTGNMTGQLRIAGFPGAPSFLGALHGFCLYSVAVPDAELAAIAGSKRHRVGTTQPTGCWHFDTVADGVSADAASIPDRSGNARTLTGDNGANNTGLTARAESKMSYRGGVQ